MKKNYRLYKIALGAVCGSLAVRYYQSKKETWQKQAAIIQEEYSHLSQTINDIQTQSDTLISLMHDMLPKAMHDIQTDIQQFKFKLSPRIEELKKYLND